MITSLIGMPELPNFGHVITSKTKFELRDEILLMTSWKEIIIS